MPPCGNVTETVIVAYAMNLRATHMKDGTAGAYVSSVNRAVVGGARKENEDGYDTAGQSQVLCYGGDS